MYSKTTHHITVTVQPYFLDEHSNISENRYVWAYRVAIQNNRQGTVKLCRRHWQITDAAGRHQEVRGDGVVGEQPVIPPGGCFEYTSGVPLSAPSGIMMGVYDVPCLLYTSDAADECPCVDLCLVYTSDAANE
ncbi:MAG: Co2+/Mg2+ efflux protein ApaG, partial [Holosporales bacterium]